MAWSANGVAERSENLALVVSSEDCVSVSSNNLDEGVSARKALRIDSRH